MTSQPLIMSQLFSLEIKQVRTITHFDGFNERPEILVKASNHLHNRGMEDMCFKAMPMSSAQALQDARPVSSRCFDDLKEQFETLKNLIMGDRGR